MYLFMDTSGKYLNIGLFNDDGIIEFINEEALRKQSELILPTIDALLKRHGLSVDDLKKIIITRGPGSYTGVRIAMSVAKVLCSLKTIELYTLSTLQAMCGKDGGCALIDARSKRVFIGAYKDNQVVLADTTMDLVEAKVFIEQSQLPCFGDDLLVEKECRYNILDNVIALRDIWDKVENVHTLVPAYCKDQESYGK